MPVVMWLFGLFFFAGAVFIGRHIVSDIQLQIVATLVVGGAACCGIGYMIWTGDGILRKLRRWERQARNDDA